MFAIVKVTISLSLSFFFLPLTHRSSENVPLKSNEDGSYVASWVPSTSGNYLIQVFIDGKSAGTVHTHCGVVHTMCN